MTLYDIYTTQHARDFTAGVRLLAEHGGDRHLTRLAWSRMQALAFGGGYVDNYNRGKLENALRQCAQEPGATPASPPTPSPGERGGEGASRGGVTPLSPGEGVGGEAAKALHKRHAHTHALMVTADTDEARAGYAREIMQEIVPDLDAEYDRLRAGDTPPLEGQGEAIRPILNAHAAATLEKLLSVRSRISNLRGKLKREKDPGKRAKLESELNKKIAERDALQQKLD